MTPKRLQRLVVCMLFDETLRERVYHRCSETLSRFEISAMDWENLTRCDLRRWSADQTRCARALTGLIDEFPVSILLYRRHFDFTQLNSFFTAQSFHDAILNDESLALTFGHWLEKRLSDVSSIALIETAVARCRRGIERHAERGQYVLNPSVLPLEVPAGTTELYARLRASLPQAASELMVHLCQPGALSFELPAIELEEAVSEYLLVDLNTGAGISHISDAMFQWLGFLQRGRSHVAVIDHSKALGLVGSDLEALLDELQADNTILC